MLDIIGKITKFWNRKNGGAHNVFIVDQAAILIGIGVPLGAVADDGRVLLIGDNAHDPVGSDGILIQHEGDDRALTELGGIHLFHIDQGAGMIGWLHGAGKNRKHLQAHQPGPHQQQRQQHRQRNKGACENIPDFPDRGLHSRYPCLP